jgi:putative spermidine/putrescine transport system substrate-binding protein
VVAIVGSGIARTIRQAKSETLIVNSYGGPYQAIINDRIIRPFEEKYGVNVVYDAAGSASQDYAKIKATKGRPGFDVVTMTASQSLQGCEDRVLQPLNAKNIPNLAFLDEGVRRIAGPCGAVYEVQYMALIWRTDKLAESPSSWRALSDDAVDKHLLLPKFENEMSVYLMQVLSLMDGGSLEDIDLGFDAVAKLAPRALAFERSSALMAKYLEDERAWIGVYWSGRAELLKRKGVPVDYTIPEEGTMPLIVTANIPAGARNKVNAEKFINFWLEKTSQEAWVEGYGVGSIRTDLDLPVGVREKQITSQADIDRLHLPDLMYIAEKRAEWGARWSREVTTAAN